MRVSSTVLVALLLGALCVISAWSQSSQLEALFAEKEQQVRACRTLPECANGGQVRTLATAVVTAYKNRKNYQCTCSYYDCKTVKEDFDSCSTRHGYQECSAGRYAQCFLVAFSVQTK